MSSPSKWLKSPKKTTENPENVKITLPNENAPKDTKQNEEHVASRLQQDHRKIQELLDKLENESEASDNILQTANNATYDFSFSMGELSIEDLLDAPIEMPSMLLDTDNESPILWNRLDAISTSNKEKAAGHEQKSVVGKNQTEYATTNTKTLYKSENPTTESSDIEQIAHEYPKKPQSKDNMERVLDGFMQDADEYMSYLDGLKTSNEKKPFEDVIESTIRNDENYSITFDSLSDTSVIQVDKERILSDSIAQAQAQHASGSSLKSVVESSDKSQIFSLEQPASVLPTSGANASAINTDIVENSSEQRERFIENKRERETEIALANSKEPQQQLLEGQERRDEQMNEGEWNESTKQEYLTFDDFIASQLQAETPDQVNSNFNVNKQSSTALLSHIPVLSTRVSKPISPHSPSNKSSDNQYDQLFNKASSELSANRSANRSDSKSDSKSDKSERSKQHELSRVNDRMIAKSLSNASFRSSASISDLMNQSQESVLVPMQEIDNLQQTIKNLRSKLLQSETNLSKQKSETEKWQKEAGVLEKIRIVEQQDIQDTLRKSEASLKLGSSDSRIKKLQKDNFELERLVKGYQTENEKLINKMKTLQKQLTETNALKVLKEEQRLSEINSLKRQLSSQASADLGQVEWQVKAEQFQQENFELKCELDELKEDLNRKNASLLHKIQILERQRASAAAAEPVKPCALDSNKGNQTLSTPAEPPTASVQIRDSDKDVIVTTHLVSNEETNKINNNLNEIQELKQKLENTTREYERLVSTLEDHKAKHSALLDEIDQSKQQNQLQLERLNAELSTVKRDQLVTLKQDTPKVHWEKQETSTMHDQPTSNTPGQEDSRREQPESMPGTAAGSSRIIRELTQQNIELEDTISNQIRLIKTTKQQMQEIEQAYTAQIAALTAQLQQSKSQIAIKGDFMTAERNYMDQIQDLNVQLDKSLSENSRLTNQLQVSEATRKAIHENTIIILKQAQEESAKIALHQHERSLSILRAQTTQNNQQMLDIEVGRLVKHLQHSERDNLALKQEIQDLKEEIEQLKHESAELQEQFLHGANESPAIEPSEYKENENKSNSLQQKLKQMELRLKQRQLQLEKVLQDEKSRAEHSVAKVEAKYKALLERKNQQITHFKHQLDSLVYSLKQKKQAATFI